MVWLFEFLRGLCCAVIQLYTPYPSRTVHSKTFAGIIKSQPFDHDFDMCPHHRFAQGPLLRQRVGCQCTTGICNSNEVGKSPAFRAATRCGADAMRRCDGDATAMRPRRRRCNRTETVRNRSRNWRRNRRSICRYFLQKYSSRYVQAFLARYLHIVAHSDIRAAYHCADSASMSSYVMTNTCTYILPQVHILLSQLQIHAHSDTYMQIVNCRYWIPSWQYWIPTSRYPVLQVGIQSLYVGIISKIVADKSVGISMYLSKNTVR